MRIAIDARHLSRSRYSGTGQITYHLIKYLLLLDDNNRYFIFLDKNNFFFDKDKRKNVQFIESRFSSYRIYNHIWRNVFLPFYLKKNQIGIFFSAVNYGIPIIKSCIYITSILDIVPIIYPDEYLKIVKKRLVYFFYLKNALKKSNHFITISEYSKKDIVEKLNIDKRRISVVHLAIPDIYFEDLGKAKNAINNIKTKFEIKQQYILTIGSTEPRKNISRLISAYKYLSESGKMKDYQLVVIGKQWEGESIDRIYDKTLFYEKKVIFTGYVSDEEIISLYASAAIFVFPSLYEGFGIPPLEAMACGTPVIASNTSSIPEVLGDAALLFDPYNIEEISNTMYKVLTNEHLQSELRERGYKRIKKFSWEKTAGETLKVFQKVYKDSQSGLK